MPRSSKVPASHPAARVSLAVALVALVALPASAQTLGPSADFGAYASAATLHVDAVQTGNTRLADVEVAFSGVGVESKAGLASALSNEMQRIVVPAQSGKKVYARGAGIEIGLGQAPSAEAQLVQAGKAEAAALPSTDLVTREIGPVTGSTAVYASLLRGQALARYDADPCETVGSELARGVGYAADVQLVDGAANAATPTLDAPALAADATDPTRTVSQTTSRAMLIPQVGTDGKIKGGANLFGMLTEIRQTIAPITLLRGTANQLTVEVLGEWVLQTVATGLPAGGFVHYGPRNVSPETPILRTINAAGTVTNVRTFQDVFGPTGQTLVNQAGVAEITLGEDPRAIGGTAASAPTIAADGTRTEAAVDVVRIKLLEQTDATGAVTTRAANLRLGHMETKARVPAAGISCPLPVTKIANPSAVLAGSSFTTTITVRNPFECPVQNVKLVDVISTQEGAAFNVTGTSPTADSVPAGDALTTATITWNDIGPIAPNASKSVTITLATKKPGRIPDTASATATLVCPPETALGAARVAGVALANEAVAGSGTTLVPIGGLPRTGDAPRDLPAPWALQLVAVLACGELARRVARWLK